MKKILFLIVPLLFIGCSFKDAQFETVVKTEHVYIQKCDIYIPANVFNVSETEVPELKDNSPASLKLVKEYIKKIYLENLENKESLIFINELYKEYTKCLEN